MFSPCNCINNTDKQIKDINILTRTMSCFRTQNLMKYRRAQAEMEIGRGDWALLDHLETIDTQVTNLRYST